MVAKPLCEDSTEAASELADISPEIAGTIFGFVTDNDPAGLCENCPLFNDEPGLGNVNDLAQIQLQSVGWATIWSLSGRKA
jgi:hypothetical protein